MTSNLGYKTASEGAETPVMLAVGLPDNGPSGGFFENMRESEW